MTPILGKIIGGLIGLNFGLVGLFVGLLIGHFFDTYVDKIRALNDENLNESNRFSRSSDFWPDIDEDGLAYGLFRLFGAFVAASGGPNRQQVTYLETVATRFMNLGRWDYQAGLTAFQRALREQPRPLEVAAELAESFILDTQTLRFVWTVCKDLIRLGHPTERLWQELERTAEYFGFRVRRKSARSRFEEDFSSFPPRSPRAEDPYKVLGVDRQASNDQIKAAFRRLARENHPDAQSHLKPDDPERLKKQEAFIKIQEAYEAIRQERGF